MLKSLYKKAFDIRDGEITISFFMQLYIFLVITVLLIVKPTVNALFLSALGAERLPYGFLMVAAVAIVSSYFYNKAIKKYSFRKVATISLLSFGLLFVLLSLALHLRFLGIWVLYFYYVLISLFAVVVTSQFWILANMVYNAREAKRLFGFIGAGAIAGGIFGGYLTTLISANFGNKVSIFVAAILTIACIPILFKIWKMRLKELTIYTRRKKIYEESAPNSHAFQLILKSKHLLFTALIIGVGVLVAKLVDYQFSDFAHRAIPNADELASFLGFWFSSFNVVALLIQLFVTNRVLSYLGVTSTLLILPLGIALGSLLFITVPELWVLIIIKGLDGSFKQSINKAAAELSILPIPYAIKNQAKSFIDIVVDSVATGIAGCLLIFGIKGMEMGTLFVTVLILLFLFAWLILIYKLRDAYFNSFRKNLESLIGDNPQKGFKRETTIETARRILTSGNEKDILVLLDRLSTTKLKPLRKQIITLLNHPSKAVKLAALEQLYFYNEGTALQRVQELLTTDDDDVVIAALQYLLHHTKLNDNSLFKKYLDHKDSTLARAALLCLAKDARTNKKLRTDFSLVERIQDKVDQLSTPEGLENADETEDLLLTIAYARAREFYYYISIHFGNKNNDVIKHAIKAAGITTDPEFIHKLLPFLAYKKFRKATIKSLTAYGPEITTAILKLENQEVFNSEVRRHLPRVVAAFNTQDAVKVLYKFLLSKDVITRRQASKSLQILQKDNDSIHIDHRRITKLILSESAFYQNTINALGTFTSLVHNTRQQEFTTDSETEILVARETIIQMLRDQLDQSMNSIFTLLSLRYNHEDIKAAYFGVKSNDDEAKINAIEFLDNLLHIKFKNRILPLLEYTVLEDDVTAISSFDLELRSELVTVKNLLAKRGKRIKLALLHLIIHLEDKAYLSLINRLQYHADRDISQLAIRATTLLKS